MTTTTKKKSRKTPAKGKANISIVPTVEAGKATNAELVARRDASVARGVASAAPIYASRAENSELWDVEGNRYVDFAGGIAVLNTGHRHPKVIAAAKAQEDHYTHTSFQVVPYEPYVALAEKLNALAPGDHAKKSLLVTTGAEAVENAVKIARAATGRPGVIAFTGGYHGRTLLTLGMTGKVSPYKKDVGPFPSDIFRAPFPSLREGITVEDALTGLQNLFLTDAQPERVAAIIIEPVLGEGGYTPVPFEMMQALREICDTHGILLIADEIQAGFGRTGTWFAVEHSGVVPDLITVAKSMAGGYPIAGVIGRAEVMDAVIPGGLGGTYGGNPVACAAALAAIEAIEEEDLLARSTALGEHFRARFSEIGARVAPFRMWDIRGLGAMLAVEFVTDFETATPDADLTKAVVAHALKRGLILLACGMHGNALRIMVPLTASDTIIDEGIAIFEEALAAAVAEQNA
ncbi:4-aminobutyrate--2-oxoglutarate transaminase [Sulfitobacter mediterraneus]|uniref:4-aminobutyrate--2-oxoglutarate transaminase n=1 Tax=Sulfitobacter mediterraneus TaxID=83219 RepID=UPI00193327D5|nr:4-aminobutyrate--2-oxoglutarate transaminase [Sulfitobacter mediterraneus]MBM1309018.1 4-aminobutyrate--2-oxoglutarate transaminase [Sulfitobacter mediterraneus]MBM1312903.1 4-aminobutyrate--2-oxoglutarate transaminase [Sulfitobacter mediterraneus]MBM1321285.1 4-aminobutyrate--2-oxoglutarate transaminase [Sulfitobacter mediterraneus]MBM1325172.1 4-aminobutyrate--2-oxoglutarate transaminase [Sulfitobacter mediterraneus]MBM1396519.1 4-aminobutyrate--2-oxoglutarate transaminase [Sulfitobacter 